MQGLLFGEQCSEQHCACGRAAGGVLLAAVLLWERRRWEFDSQSIAGKRGLERTQGGCYFFSPFPNLLGAPGGIKLFMCVYRTVRSLQYFFPLHYFFSSFGERLELGKKQGQAHYRGLN